MSIYLYDEALVNKIKNWTEETSIHIYGPNETKRLFTVIANENNDNPIELPLISISRNGGFNVLNLSKQPLAYNSLKIEANQEKSMLLNAIPINIQYQIDVYTRYYKEADEIARNLIFNLIDYPRIQIEIPYYDKKIKHDSKITLASEVQDNSSIPERLIAGQFTRLTLAINIDDAYIWDVRIKDNVKLVEVSVSAKSLDSNNYDFIEKENIEN